jgi:hypothetical protein
LALALLMGAGALAADDGQQVVKEFYAAAAPEFGDGSLLRKDGMPSLKPFLAPDFYALIVKILALPQPKHPNALCYLNGGAIYDDGLSSPLAAVATSPAIPVGTSLLVPVTITRQRGTGAPKSEYAFAIVVRAHGDYLISDIAHANNGEIESLRTSLDAAGSFDCK